MFRIACRASTNGAREAGPLSVLVGLLMAAVFGWHVPACFEPVNSIRGRRASFEQQPSDCLLGLNSVRHILSLAWGSGPNNGSAKRRSQSLRALDWRLDSVFLFCSSISMDEHLPFKVVWTNAHDEVLARSMNLLIGRAAYETAVRMYPRDAIEYRYGDRVIASSAEQRAGS